MEARSLAQYIDTPEFTDFLENLNRQALDETGPPKSTFSFDRSNVDVRLNNYTDAAVLRTYLALGELFEAIPSLKELTPKWSVVHQVDHTMIVEFSMILVLETDAGKVRISARQGEFDKLHNQFPSLFPDHAQAQYDNAFSCGEMILPEHWNCLVTMDIFANEAPFTSKSNVMSRMNKDLEAFLPEVKKWALGQQVNHKQTQVRSAPKI